jgi:glycosyltransferase involved in cell wall biosynthesis/tetratricopeptide (TPR) repeat protein
MLARKFAPAEVVRLAGSTARLLADSSRVDEAVALLERGIDLAPPQYSAFSLYQTGGEILAAAGRVDEAVALLERGIDLVPPKFNAFALYQTGGKILAAAGRVDEAVALLGRGIDLVPPQYSAVSLYNTAGEILAAEDREDEAVALLKRGIDLVLPKYNAFTLYQTAGEILAGAERVDEAVALLELGISRVPPQYSAFSLYQVASAALSLAGRYSELYELMLRGAQIIPTTQNQHRVAESLIFTAAANGDLDILERVADAEWVTPPVGCLARVLACEVKGVWDSAAREAARGRQEHSKYIALCSHYVLALLACGNPKAAQEALNAFPRKISHEAAAANTWLAAAVAIHNLDIDNARSLLDTFLGAGSLDPDVTPESLLRCLTRLEGGLMGPKPTFVFPILPSTLFDFRPQDAEIPVGASSCQVSTVGASDDIDDRLHALIVATEWAPAHGGVSTFNQELGRALARCKVRVFCLVPSCSNEEIENARSDGVELILTIDRHFMAPETRLIRRPRLPVGARIDVVIGHGRQTGAAAACQAEDHFPGAKRIHFVHVAPGAIEWFKSTPAGPEFSAAEQAKTRVKIEVALAREASAVAAVGPLLRREIEAELSGYPEAMPPIVEFLPGAPNVEPVLAPPEAVRVLIAGRLEDYQLKGLDIAARAFGILLGLEGIQNLRPTLIALGAPAGTGSELRDKLLGDSANSVSDIRTIPFDSDRLELSAEIRRSSVVLMPSRSEGYGLVGLEALAMQVPVLISRESGLFEHLYRLLPDQSSCLGLTCRGELEDVAYAWASAIRSILVDRRSAFQRMADISRHFRGMADWDQAVEDLLNSIGIEQTRTRGPTNTSI